MTTFWSTWICVLTIGSLIGLTWLCLLYTSPSPRDS